MDCDCTRGTLCTGADPDQILTDAQLKCQGWGKIQLEVWGGAVSPPVGSGQGPGGGPGGKAPEAPRFSAF